MHALILAFVQGLALGQADQAADPCAAAATHHGYTILLEASGHFVHCRDGRTTEEEPVSHEDVDLQLPPEGPGQPWRYRLFDPGHPQAGNHNPLLRDSLEVLQDYETALRDLASGPETLGETLQHLAPAGGGEEAPPAAASRKDEKAPPAISIARESPDTLAASAAEAKYLSYATPAFSDAVHALRRNARLLQRAAERVDDVCQSAADKVRAGELRQKVGTVCAGSPGQRLVSDLAPFLKTLDEFREARNAAREAVLDLDLTPGSATEQDAAARKATQALGAATALARRLDASAQATADEVESLHHDAQFLRAAVSLPSTPEAPRLHLGHFSANGIFGAPDVYQVNVQRRPSRFLDLEEPAPGGQTAEKPEEREILTDRFEPAPRNYIDIGVSLMYSAGLPDHPILAGQLGHQQLVQSQTAGFNGGILFALEPLEFTTLPDPFAMMLHFPTVIVPFTIDPLRNYFIGAGFSAYDWVSLDFGLHLAFTRVPSPDNSYGQTFTTSPIDINHVTTYGPLAGGWFVSLSVDLFGIIHSVVDQLSPTVRDVHSFAPVAAPPPQQ